MFAASGSFPERRWSPNKSGGLRPASRSTNIFLPFSSSSILPSWTLLVAALGRRVDEREHHSNCEHQRLERMSNLHGLVLGGMLGVRCYGCGEERVVEEEGRILKILKLPRRRQHRTSGAQKGGRLDLLVALSRQTPTNLNELSEQRCAYLFLLWRLRNASKTPRLLKVSACSVPRSVERLARRRAILGMCPRLDPRLHHRLEPLMLADDG